VTRAIIIRSPGASDFSGAYTDLTGKPTLGGAAALDVGTTSGTVAAGDAAPKAHASSHSTGQPDAINPANIGAASTSHASTHASGGSDAVTLAQSQVTNLTTDLAAKLVAASNLSDLADAEAARGYLEIHSREYPVYWTGSAWPSRPTLPSGYDRVEWRSFDDAAATDPSANAEVGDLWWWASGGGPA
jgi:hypothetical protein